MGLFDNATEDTRTQAEKIAEGVLKSVRNQGIQIAQQYAINYSRIWFTSGVDPKDIIAALGTNAGPLFLVTNQTMIIAEKADQLKSIPERFTYTVNADGSMTLTDVPEVIPELPAEPPADTVSGGAGDGPTAGPAASSSGPGDLTPVSMIGGG